MTIRPGDREEQAGQLLVGDAVLLLLQRGRQRGQVVLEGRDSGGAARQPHAHGRVLVRGQQLVGGGGRENAAIGHIGLVDQRGRRVHDRGQPVGADHRPAGRQPVGADPEEGIGDLPAHVHAEQPPDGWRDHHVVRGIRRGQPPGQHGQPVLLIPLAVQRPVQAGGQERPGDVAVNHRRAQQAQVRGAGRDPGQVGDQRERPGGRHPRQLPGHVHECVADVGRPQVAAVGGVRAPGARHRGQRHRPEHAAQQDQHDQRPPGPPGRRPPQVQRSAHPGPPPCLSGPSCRAHASTASRSAQIGAHRRHHDHADIVPAWGGPAHGCCYHLGARGSTTRPGYAPAARLHGGHLVGATCGPFTPRGDLGAGAEKKGRIRTACAADGDRHGAKCRPGQDRAGGGR